MLSGSGHQEEESMDSQVSDTAPAPKTKKTPKIEEEIHIEDIPF